MAARPYLNSLSDHRRDAKGIHRTTGIAVRTVRQSDRKWRRRHREGIRDINLVVGDADEVIVVQRDHCLMNRVGGTLRESSDDVLYGNWPATIQERLKDPPGDGRFPPGPSSSPPLQVQGRQPIGVL